MNHVNQISRKGKFIIFLHHVMVLFSYKFYGFLNSGIIVLWLNANQWTIQLVGIWLLWRNFHGLSRFALRQKGFNFCSSSMRLISLIVIQNVNQRNLTDGSTLILPTTNNYYLTSASGTWARVLTGSTDVTSGGDPITSLKFQAVRTQIAVLHIQYLQ